MRIGVPWEFLEDLKPESRKIFDEAIDTFKKLGAQIVDIDLSTNKYGIAAYYILTPAEASTNLARFDGVRYGLRSKDATSIDEVYDMSKEEGFGKEVKRRILLGTHVLSSGFKGSYYQQAQKVRTLMIRQYAKAFTECDLIAMPTSPGTAFEAGALKEPLELYLEDVYTVTANLVGCPSINVPAGFCKSNKPFGLQLMGPQMADKKVIVAANAFEKAKNYSRQIPESFKR
jgi:aspartyl-tRNA(Asn)/glutamyl-tRNA(Gln) amidotransferase subunit A